MLRALALNALQAERGNLEGATAFAAFVPRTQRRAAVRAMIAFQAAYDYADAISEQSWQHRPRDSTACLHRSLSVAVDPELGHVDYYAHSPHKDDGQYLRDLVSRCQSELTGLPSISVATAALRRAAMRIEIYQRANHDRGRSRDRHREYWAATEVSQDSDLAWWEVAASAGSSLTIFALIALVARVGADRRRVRAIEHVYFPWIGALHTLLDSLVDRREDAEVGQSSLIDNYSSEAEARARLEVLASRTSERVSRLGERHHGLILSAMASFYLSGAHHDDLLSQVITPRVLAMLGNSAEWTAYVMGAKRLISCLLAKASSKSSS